MACGMNSGRGPVGAWFFMVVVLLWHGGGGRFSALAQTNDEADGQPVRTVVDAANEGEAVAAKTVQVDPRAADQQIAQRLTKILRATQWFENPQTDVTDGVAFLRGRTRRAQYRDWATQLAQQTEGVVAVVNRIELVDGPLWNFEPAYAQMRSLWRVVVQSLPLWMVGVAILVASYLAARGARMVAQRLLTRRVQNLLLRDVAAKAVAVPVFLIGLYVVLHVAGLTRLALTVLGGTGLAGLVIGIAFRDIAENFLASLLLSVQNPFRPGDLIRVDQHLGVVQKVTTRGTLLMDFDGTFIQIPNSIIYKSVVLNYTANARSRLSFAFGVGYDTPVVEAQRVALGALRDHPAVLDDPEPMVLVEALGASSVSMRAYFWIDSRQHSPPRVTSSVIRLVKRALLEAGVTLPDEAREILFPAGVPVRLLQDELPAVAEPSTGTASGPGLEEPADVSTPGEGELRSEIEQIEQQARTSRQPDEGIDLLQHERNS